MASDAAELLAYSQRLKRLAGECSRLPAGAPEPQLRAGAQTRPTLKHERDPVQVHAQIGKSSTKLGQVCGRKGRTGRHVQAPGKRDDLPREVSAEGARSFDEVLRWNAFLGLKCFRPAA